MDDVKQRISEADLPGRFHRPQSERVLRGWAGRCLQEGLDRARATSDDMTFDVRHIRSIRYSNTMGADIRLRDDLHQALRGLGYKLPPATR